MRTEEMEEILAKYFSGNATEKEKERVENWRGESEENALQFLDAREAWLVTGNQMEPDAVVVLEQLLNSKEVERVPLLLRSWVKYASAAILILALSLLFILNQLAEKDTPGKTLADGTIVKLHQESKMEVLKFDNDSREVRLEGKAYFDVKRDESRPFYILTDQAKIKVLGTSFVVDTYEGKTQVSVETGLVQLRKSDNLLVELQRGEVGLIANGNQGIIKKTNTDDNYLAWKTKVIVFEETPLALVKEVIEDVYGVQISFADPSFEKCSYTATLEQKSLRDVLEIISRTFGVGYELAKKEVVFKGRGC